MPKGLYYQLRHLTQNAQGEEIDRRIWTFENETDANECYEFFIGKGASAGELYVEEVEVS